MESNCLISGLPVAGLGDRVSPSPYYFPKYRRHILYVDYSIDSDVLYVAGVLSEVMYFLRNGSVSYKYFVGYLPSSSCLKTV